MYAKNADDRKTLHRIPDQILGFYRLVKTNFYSYSNPS